MIDATSTGDRSHVRCFHHGPEPVTDRTYLVCFECHHPFEAQELLDAHNAILADLRALAAAEPPTADPAWVGASPPDLVDPAEVRVCPLCTHDL
jgi:hypothetical protein